MVEDNTTKSQARLTERVAMVSLSDIANLATALAFFLLAYQVYLQRKDQKNQSIAHLFDELVTPEFRRQLLFVYSHKPEELIVSKLTDSERDIVENVTARFDGLGFRVRKGTVPKTEALELFWDLVVRSAQQLRPHILDQREKRQESQIESAGHKIPRKSTNLDELLKVKPLPIFTAHTSDG